MNYKYLMNYKIRELASNIIAQSKTTLLVKNNKIVIHSWLIHSRIYYLWLIPDELASCMAPGF